MQKKQGTTIAQAQESSDPSQQPSRPSISPQSPIMTITIAWALQGGVIVSSFILVIGCWLLLFSSPHQLSAHDLQTFPHTIAQVWTGLLMLQPQAVIALGLLLLIATPVIRVAVSLLAFALEHDWLYVVITFLVLAILIISFLLGKSGA